MISFLLSPVFGRIWVKLALTLVSFSSLQSEVCNQLLVVQLIRPLSVLKLKLRHPLFRLCLGFPALQMFDLKLGLLEMERILFLL